MRRSWGSSLRRTSIDVEDRAANDGSDANPEVTPMDPCATFLEDGYASSSARGSLVPPSSAVDDMHAAMTEDERLDGPLAVRIVDALHMWGVRLKDAFDEFDKDLSGSLDVGELTSLCEAFGIRYQVYEVENLLANSRRAKGEMTYKEFRSTLRSIVSKRKRPKQTTDASQNAIEIGIRVKVVALTQRPELNGKTGVVRAWSAEDGKWKVVLDDGQNVNLSNSNVVSAYQDCPRSSKLSKLPMSRGVGTSIIGKQASSTSMSPSEERLRVGSRKETGFGFMELILSNDEPSNEFDQKSQTPKQIKLPSSPVQLKATSSPLLDNNLETVKQALLESQFLELVMERLCKLFKEKAERKPEKRSPLKDREAVQQANRLSVPPAIPAKGRRVSFASVDKEPEKQVLGDESDVEIMEVVIAPEEEALDANEDNKADPQRGSDEYVRQSDVSQSSPNERRTAATMRGSVWNYMPFDLYTSENQYRTPVFPDEQAMKEKIKANIGSERYDVKNFYKEEGLAQYVARSQFFENASQLVIVFNAIWVAIDTEFNTQSATLLEAPLLFQIVENFFCCYFFFELVVRWAAFKSKLDGLTDKWFIFDAILVSFAVIDVWLLTLVFLIFFGSDGVGSIMSDATVLRLFRLVRLTKLGRMARILTTMPELMILCKAIFSALRSVTFTLVLLGVIVYIFAIALCQMTHNSAVNTQYFSGVFPAMGTLLVDGTFPDNQELFYDCFDGNPLWSFVIFVFILIGPTTIMGMLAGVLVECVSVTAAVEKERTVVSFVDSQIKRMLKNTELTYDDAITKEEFSTLLLQPEWSRVLSSVGVDVVGLAESGDFMYHNNETITMDNFMELVLQMRGSNVSTVKDIVDLRKFFRKELSEQHDEFKISLTELLGNNMKNVTRALVKGASLEFARLDSQESMPLHRMDSRGSSRSRRRKASPSRSPSPSGGSDRG